MKKKLTVNTLALGNLKQRRGQYTIMIIGIILAMVFSSSIVLFMFSSVETNTEINKKRYGSQTEAYVSQELTDKDYKQAVKDNILESYGYMHNIGYAYSDEDSKYLGAAVTWMDDTADDLYYLTLLEGRKPTAENEIAIEKTVLKKLGYKEGKLGDTIKLKLDVANGLDFEDTVEKEYTIVGIYDDRKSYNEETTPSTYRTEYDTITPGIYVAKNSQVEPGGKELLIAVLNASKNAKFYSSEDNYTYKSNAACQMYFYEKTGNDLIKRMNGGYSHNRFMIGSNSFNLTSGSDLLAVIIVALIFASCISIVNSFNTNLKERKKQIGMLRAVGTTRRQIINIFGREAFIISLISTPISIAVSYAIVWIALNIIGNDCVMSKSLLALVIAAFADIIVVMLAALIPLFFASRTSPMQAIRDIDTNRKAKNKKVKSKKNFAPASHIARRNTKFYKGSTIAVSVMLTVTICFSCVAFSFVSHEAENMLMYPHDYRLEQMSANFIDENLDTEFGLTEVDRQEIASLPYVKNTYGEKNIHCVIEVDEVNDFIKIMDYQTYEYKGDYVGPSSNEELKENLKQTAPKQYVQSKKELNIEKEMVKSKITAFDKKDLNKIENLLTDGKIDYDKLVSGEEVIFVCPQQAELLANISQRMYDVTMKFDNEVGKYPPKYEHIMQAESPYKVGDELTVYIPVYHYDEDNDKSTLKSLEKKTVKIGAIISPTKFDYYSIGIAASEFTIITSMNGMNNFRKGVSYETISFDVNEDVDDDLDAKITEDMTKYTQKYQGYFDSAYYFTNWQKKEIQRIIVALVAVVIIGFAICISIINNSISAQIRENKRVIGTLRAVGADRKELSKSYIYQMLSMFGRGTGFGYGIFLLIIGIIKLVSIKFGGNFDFMFNPWITIAMTIFSFVICSINVFAKVKKEMKNSIVENIREL